MYYINIKDKIICDDIQNVEYPLDLNKTDNKIKQEDYICFDKNLDELTVRFGEGYNKYRSVDGTWIYQNRVNVLNTLKGDELCQMIIEIADAEFERIETPDSTLFAARSKNFLGWPTRFYAQITPKNEKEMAKFNWGCMRPEGYRFLSKEIVEINETPFEKREHVVCVGDTQGGEAGTRAAKLNQCEAVSSCIKDMGSLNTVKAGIINRNGGSGGVWAVVNGLPLAIFSDAIMAVIGPPHCSSILWRDNKYVKEAVELLKCSSKWLYDFGLVDEVLDAPYDMNNYSFYAKSAFKFIKKQFARQTEMKLGDFNSILEETEKRITGYGRKADLKENNNLVNCQVEENMSVVGEKLRLDEEVDGNIKSNLKISKKINIIKGSANDDLSKCSDVDLIRYYHRRDILKLDITKDYYFCKIDNKQFQTGCGKEFSLDEYLENFKSCPNCGKADALNAHEIIHSFLDNDSYFEFFSEIKPDDLLPAEIMNHEIPAYRGGKVKYKDSIKSIQKKTGSSESLITGIGRINGYLTAVAVNDFSFMGGSMGVVFGERFIKLVDYCLQFNLPLIYISCTGGARMQEGTLSLAQMGKTCHWIKKLVDKGLPAVAVAMHPTSGGVPAGPLFQFPIIIGEYNAMLSFSGPRVVRLAGGDLDERCISTNYQSQVGFIDEVVNRKGLKMAVSKYLKSYFFLNTDYARIHTGVSMNVGCSSIIEFNSLKMAG